MLRSSRVRLSALAALSLAAAALGGVACSAERADDGGESTEAQRASSGARAFTLDADWKCQIQDMSTLAYTDAPSRGHVKVKLSFSGDPAVSSQVDAIVKSRPQGKFRQYGKVSGGKVTVDIARDAIDGTGAKLATKFVVADLEGRVNADESGDESPYRLFYEINDGLQPHAPDPARDATFGEQLDVVLYNIGNAGKSFTMVASTMLELDTDGGAYERLYCRARAQFADPKTGALPKPPTPIVLDDDAGADDVDAGPAVAWPFPK